MKVHQRSHRAFTSHLSEPRQREYLCEEVLANVEIVQASFIFDRVPAEPFVDSSAKGAGSFSASGFTLAAVVDLDLIRSARRRAVFENESINLIERVQERLSEGRHLTRHVFSRLRLDEENLVLFFDQPNRMTRNTQSDLHFRASGHRIDVRFQRLDKRIADRLSVVATKPESQTVADQDGRSDMLEHSALLLGFDGSLARMRMTEPVYGIGQAEAKCVAGLDGRFHR